MDVFAVVHLQALVKWNFGLEYFYSRSRLIDSDGKFAYILTLEPTNLHLTLREILINVDERKKN